MRIPVRDRRVALAIMAAGLVLATVLGYHVVYGQNGYFTYRSQQRRYLELQQKTDALKNENESLQKEIDAINRHDPAMIEQKARQQQLARRGEKIYTYTSQDPQASGPDAPPARPAPANSSTAPSEQH